MSEVQEVLLPTWIKNTSPRSTRQFGAYVEREFGAASTSLTNISLEETTKYQSGFNNWAGSPVRPTTMIMIGE